MHTPGGGADKVYRRMFKDEIEDVLAGKPLEEVLDR